MEDEADGNFILYICLSMISNLYCPNATVTTLISIYRPLVRKAYIPLFNLSPQRKLISTRAWGKNLDLIGVTYIIASHYAFLVLFCTPQTGACFTDHRKITVEYTQMSKFCMHMFSLSCFSALITNLTPSTHCSWNRNKCLISHLDLDLIFSSSSILHVVSHRACTMEKWTPFIT